jgi:MFS family permease
VADRIGHLGRALNILLWVFAAVFCLAGVFLHVSNASVGAGLKYAGLALAVLMLFFFYTLNNLRMPISTGFLSDRTHSQQRATVLSVLSQLRAVMAAVVAPLLGLVADKHGIPFVFLVGGAVLIGASLVLRLQSRPPAPEADPEVA